MCTRVAAVFQDYLQLDLSAAENIGVGDIEHLNDRARIVAAAREAGAHDDLDRLPKGYDTLLSRMFLDSADEDDPETGVFLSGGQGQRVAIARAMFRGDRDLLVLDEPSSGLDATAEHTIHARLREHRKGRTSLLISHRLNTTRDADRIAVLQDGRIAELGPHDVLMSENGRYAEMFSLQASGYLETGR
ncbi:ABC transporter ATP-binding protein [Streptomyces sp. DSM 41886]|uniref:ABC transporter ATP-binding protein n=1 Tax=Streptomyces johnsoniae TaxID=3075532 RepID=A0ABU2S3A6_9ACTN|nr:ABC transporter ATP-binding protein [Streptomyces sp. DSM 41886]MDT0443440.1 ABC transporter ATP-binding protein [Streptomyces sp. DSM 41886]